MALRKYAKDIAIFVAIIVILVGFKPALSYATGTQTPVAVVKGTSMLPLLREGDIVFLIKKPPSEIHIGDIVVYKSLRSGYIIHRVISIKVIGNVVYYTTKGDNNPIDDSALGEFPPGYGITYDRIIGVVWAPYNMTFTVPVLGILSASI